MKLLLLATDSLYVFMLKDECEAACSLPSKTSSLEAGACRECRAGVDDESGDEERAVAAVE